MIGTGKEVPHRHSQLIEVRRTRKKGRGVFARSKIAKGTVIERVPLIVIPLRDVFGHRLRSELADYVFSWEKDTVAIALGYGSLYNHSYRPNARFYGSGLTQVFAAIRDILPGEEITVNYNGPPRSCTRVGFYVY
jgi:SET domain-containing protein